MLPGRVEVRWGSAVHIQRAVRRPRLQEQVSERSQNRLHRMRGVQALPFAANGGAVEYAKDAEVVL